MALERIGAVVLTTELREEIVDQVTDILRTGQVQEVNIVHGFGDHVVKYEVVLVARDGTRLSVSVDKFYLETYAG
jgi:hypothetical protein